MHVVTRKGLPVYVRKNNSDLIKKHHVYGIESELYKHSEEQLNRWPELEPYPNKTSQKTAHWHSAQEQNT